MTTTDIRPPPDRTRPGGPHVHVAVIGSGFSGIGVAIKLLQAGFPDFLIFERASQLGGTWRDNTYPGAACDVMSHLYSFSFAPKPDWKRLYASQPEILAYLEGVAERFGVTPHLRFGHELLEARWNNAETYWELQTSQGRFTADFLISGHGPLVEPKWPMIPGLERFEGELMHSARWNHWVDLHGKRVAVIGTGASAIQFVPAIQPEVRELFVFQRHAPWIMPRPDRSLSARERALFRRLPLAQQLVRGAIFARSELNALGFFSPPLGRLAARTAREHLERQIPDPELRRKLTPDYRIGCKRILVSNDFYPALTRPGTELVTERVTEIRPHAVVTADGVERTVDVLICGTGFQVAPPPIASRFRGVDGRTLAEVWAGSAQAYLGTSVAGFPNLFFMIGPNTALGHTSMVYMIEAQLAYLLAALSYLRANHLLALDVKPGVQAAYNRDLQASLGRSVWNRGGCTSFYLDAGGTNTTTWPGFASRFRRRLRRFDPGDYTFRLSPVPLGSSG